MSRRGSRDGYISTTPDAELLQRFRDNGGGDKPAQAGFKVGYAPTRGRRCRARAPDLGQLGPPG